MTNCREAEEAVNGALEEAGTFYSGDATQQLKDWTELLSVFVNRRQEKRSPRPVKVVRSATITPKRQTAYEPVPENEFSIGDVIRARSVKHCCEQCNATIWVNRIRLGRAAAPRCPTCGTVLVMASQGAESTDEILYNSNVRRVKRR